MAENAKPHKHRRWVVHSHEATRPSHSDAKSDINITPLIDVMLVLLIIFMVVTPLAQKGLDIALPQPNPNKSQDKTPPNTVVMGVENSPTGPIYTVNKNPVGNLEELDNRLKDIFQTRSDKTLFVRAGGDIAYGKVVEAMDVARGAGVERIGIISEAMVEAAGGKLTGQ
jgi:biopolymer transport protein ExbD/biopolymer transport protein TolR